MKEGEMREACITHGRDETCIQKCNRRTWK